MREETLLPAAASAHSFPIPRTSGESAPKRSQRKLSWDVVRGMCVTLVMLYHASFLSVFLHPELRPRTLWFPYQVGASLLLVISAYFACQTIGRGPLLRYWWNRIARLLPPFLAAVVLIFVVLKLAQPAVWWQPTWPDLGYNLLMFWHLQPAHYPLLDGSHWTVPLQLMGFTVAALLFASRWGHGRSMIIMLWVAVLLPIAQWPLRVSNPSESYRMLVDGLGMHRWHLFVVGVVIWLWATKRIATGHFVVLLGLCMLAQSMHNYSETPEGLVADWGSTLAVCVGMTILALTAAGPDWKRAIPRFLHRPIEWFAGISYGVFLMHQSLGYVVLYWLDSLGTPTLVQTLAMLATGVLLGWGLTRLVERPVHRWLLNLYDRGQRSVPRSAAQNAAVLGSVVASNAAQNNAIQNTGLPNGDARPYSRR